MLVKASLWLTVAQLKQVYVHYMRAAADYMIMYNNNLSTALVVATQTITPHAIVSSGAAPALAPATASLPPASAGVVAHASPDKRNRAARARAGKAGITPLTRAFAARVRVRPIALRVSRIVQRCAKLLTSIAVGARVRGVARCIAA